MSEFLLPQWMCDVCTYTRRALAAAPPSKQAVPRRADLRDSANGPHTHVADGGHYSRHTAQVTGWKQKEGGGQEGGSGS